jgi:hypothetical protein
MKSLKTGYAVIFLVLLPFLANLAPGCREVSRFLVLEEYGSGRIIRLFALDEAQEVTVRYQHSVMGVPVYQILNVSQPGPPTLESVITKERLISFPGYEEKVYRKIEPPALEVSGTNSSSVAVDSWIRIDDIHRKLSMPWLVARESIVDRTLFVNGQIMRLSEIERKGVMLVHPVVRLLPTNNAKNLGNTKS